jgi:hypothetical protein
MKIDLYKRKKAVREAPIIFSGRMVLKTLTDEKTVTRRNLNPQPPEYVDYFQYNHGLYRAYMPMGEPCAASRGFSDGSGYCRLHPKYAPGDRLWVRETFMSFPRNKLLNLTPLAGEDGFWTHGDFDYCYQADDTSHNPDNKWRPSVFLPREAARLFLNVKTVRIERLHELDDPEARLEGFKDREDFAAYWNKLNQKRGFPWAANPWVYRIEYTRIKK